MTSSLAERIKEIMKEEGKPFQKVDNLAYIFSGFYNVPFFVSVDYFIYVRQENGTIEMNKEQIEEFKDVG